MAASRSSRTSWAPLSPEAFGRSLRIAQYVRHVADKFSLRLPLAFRSSSYALAAWLHHTRRGPGAEVSSAARSFRWKIKPASILTPKQLCSFSPAFPGWNRRRGSLVNSCLRRFRRRFPACRWAAVKETVLGAKILKLAVAFDHLRIKLASDSAAIANLVTRRTEFDRELVDALNGVKAVGGGMESRKVSTLKLATGMVLDQDVRNKEGMLLVAKGQEITSALLIKLDNFAKAALIDKEIQVLVPM